MTHKRTRARKFRSSDSKSKRLLLLVRVRPLPQRALVNRAARASRAPAGVNPLAKMLRSSSPGALGTGALRHEVCRRRYHCPVPGYPLNRSRRCTRSRVPPSASLCSRSCGCHFPLRRCALDARLMGPAALGILRQSLMKKGTEGRPCRKFRILSLVCVRRGQRALAS
jgi:hypothetical protein